MKVIRKKIKAIVSFLMNWVFWAVVVFMETLDEDMGNSANQLHCFALATAVTVVVVTVLVILETGFFWWKLRAGFLAYILVGVGFRVSFKRIFG